MKDCPTRLLTCCVFYWKKTELSENQISFSINLTLLQTRAFKVTPFFTDFTDYWDFGCISATRCSSIFTEQLAEVWEDSVHQHLEFHVDRLSGTPLIIQEIVTKQLFLAIFESPFPIPSFCDRDVTDFTPFASPLI